MSLEDRRAMVDPAKSNLSVRRQCALLALARSGVYRPKSAPLGSNRHLKTIG
jgi:putative transposase